ncbi:glycosyltransferase family 4 protein [Lachnospiraceae bacterium MD1]|uniref:Glycosyltransferase family 4 protein n=1 Tax=Variimorphobacter saccharofermentans TaxID=2755051 RepID=A0A839K1N2_9FIRM|nr:glycosyltransferase family 4 protein [Variimorphobacter saccharofermentans]MBB2183540.1 glycosyltransferase family 4 protein [Variimorphobacter saccharofermentans]
MKLSYVCTWNKIKELTWSGTTFYLMKAMEKYFDLTNYDIQMDYPNGTIVNHNSSLGRAILSRKAKKILKESDANIVFQIDDYVIMEDKINCIYQDLSIDSILYHSKYKRDIFLHSNFEEVDEELLENRNKWQKQFLDKVDFVFTMSEWLAENLIHYTKLPPKKIHVVGAGVNIDVSKVNYSHKVGNKILFIGRDFERKGGVLTIEAFMLLKERMPEAELFIVGPVNKPFIGEVNGIHFIGELPYDKLPDYYNLCDVFCMPSIFEAYGIVFAEALIYGLPCIGRNDFAMSELIKDSYSGYLLNQDSPDILAEKMYDLLKNKEIHENVKKEHKNYVETYSWDAVAQRIYNILDDNKFKNI